MRIIDEKFKDSSPVETVNKINSLLAAHGLRVTEHWSYSDVANCYALRVTVDGTAFGTNGKGVTKELANASAHAELMERIQAGFVGRENIDYPDAKRVNRQELIEYCRPFFENIGSEIYRREKIQLTMEQFADACIGYEQNRDSAEILPFYSATENQMTYLPTKLLRPFFTSTGNCAGNTPEEAIVQGTSEVIERWFQRKFMCEDVVPPTIPDEYLQKFTHAYATITDIRSKGLDVIIKDCSMGSGYPVIATAIIDRKRHAYHVHLGASPIFEIALGRSMTETFQGRDADNVADTYLSESAKKDTSTYIKSFRIGRGAYPIEFFTNDSTYPFVPFPDRTSYTNRDLLRYVIDFVKKQNVHLYIRDISCMGFHSYKVVIPEMCSEPFDFITLGMGVPYLVGDTRAAELDLENATEEQLMEVQLLYLYMLNYTLMDKQTKYSKMTRLKVAEKAALDVAAGAAHIGYVEWQCGNHKVAKNYATVIKNVNEAGISDFFSAWLRATDMLKNGKELKVVIDQLSIFYDKSILDQVKRVIEDKKNPFAPYLVRCSRTDGCDGCYYRATCRVKAQYALRGIANSCAQTFDNEKAFQKLHDLMTSL